MSFNYVSFGLETSDVIGLTPAQQTAEEYQLTFSVVNEGSKLYKNFKYPRYENFYGYAQIMSGAYVIQSVKLAYLNQEILFFRDSTFGIEETVGCYAKALAGALNPPYLLITNTVKTRQRYTSVRFRLLPEIVANVGIRWEVQEAKCGGNVVEPDPRQGTPIAPNNGSSSPGNRPAEQGGDNGDRSANDGNYDPGDGLPPPPTPGGGTAFPSWHVNGLITVNAGCVATPYHYKYNDLTDPAIVPYFVPTGPNSVCSNSKNGDLIYGGAVVDKPNGVIDYTMSFY